MIFFSRVTFSVACLQCIKKWTSISSENVAIIHEDNKSWVRTLIVAAASLFAMGKHKTIKECLDHALKVLAGKATIPLLPSQSRFVERKFSEFFFYNYFFLLIFLYRYLHYVEKQRLTNAPIMHLHKVVINQIPKFKITGGCEPHWAIESGGKRVIFSKNLKGKKGKTPVEFFCKDFAVNGDVKYVFGVSGFNF